MEIAKNGEFVIKPRTSIKSIIKERLFGNQSLSTEETEKLTKNLEVDYIMVGTISKVEGLYYGSFRIYDVKLGEVVSGESIRGAANFEEYVEKLMEQIKLSMEGEESPTITLPEDTAQAPEGFEYTRTETYSCDGITYTVKEYRHIQTEMEFVLIPGGTFKMGSEDYDRTKPVHEVRIEPFLMSKYEVTQEAWERVMGSNPSNRKGDSRRPVESVSWDDCQEFCEKTGLSLPSESQWEYACRTGTCDEYYWGYSMNGEYCWYDGNSGYETYPVGEKKSNAFGLYDMSGNVIEWCQDSGSRNYYTLY